MCKTYALGHIVYWLHFFGILLIFYLSLVVPRRQAYLGVVVIALMFLNWFLDEGRCFMTRIETHLKCDDSLGGFTRRFLKDVVRVDVPEPRVAQAQNIVFTSLLVVAFGRWASTKL
jgi:hypothetical protein